MLATENLRLHKVVSNSVAVMEAFPAEDRAKSIKDLDLRHDNDCLGSTGTLRRITSPSTFHCQKCLSQEEEFFLKSTSCTTPWNSHPQSS